MITHYKYTHTRNFNRDGYEYLTVLTAHFRFLNQVAPRDRASVRRRMHPKDGPAVPCINNFFERKGYELDHVTPRILGEAAYFRTKPEEPKLAIVEYPLLFPRLAFNLKVVSERNFDFSIDKMFDLDGLDHYVLTGEIK